MRIFLINEKVTRLLVIGCIVGACLCVPTALLAFLKGQYLTGTILLIDSIALGALYLSDRREIK
jgi:uncharacterized membrane protein (GlpM family)